MAIALAVVFGFALIPTVSYADSDPIKVLIINSWNQKTPWSVDFMAGFERVAAAADQPKKIFVEYLDSGQFPGQASSDAFAEYLGNKYQESDIDYVVAESLPAVGFLGSHPNLLQPAQRVLVAPGGIEAANDQVLVPVTADYASSIAEMQRIVNPSQIVVISDTASPGGQARLDAFQAALDEQAPNLSAQYLINEPLTTVTSQVAQLPEDSAVYYLLLLQDADGTPIDSMDSLRQISAVSAVPIFSNWEILIGSGLTGGYLISPGRVGEVTWDTIAALNAGEPAPSISPTDTYEYVYDWRELDRYGLAGAELPAATRVENLEPSIWEEHRTEFGVALAVLLILVVLSLLLAIANRRQKRTLGMLSEQRELLESTVEERTKDLATANIRLQELSRTDELTGLKNRRGLMESFRSLVTWSTRNREPIAVLMVDIDHFHSYNAIYGHPAGDRAIQEVAGAIQSVARRATDVTGRYGGEEFLIALSHCSEDHARSTASRLHDAVGALNIEHSGSPEGDRLAVSIGLLIVADSIPSAERLIEAADEALLQAKAAGRSRTIAAEVSLP